MALDEADKKFIADSIAASLESQKKAIGEGVEAALKAKSFDSLEARLKAIEEAAKTKEQPEPRKGPATEGDKRIQALEEQLKAEKQAREAAETQRRKDLLANSAREALIANGVPADKVAFVMPFLESRGVLGFDGENPAYKGKDSYGIERWLPLGDGLKSWTQSQEAKHFMPASNVQGTGETRAPNGAMPRDAKGNLNLNSLADKLISTI